MKILVLSSFLSRRYAGAAHATVTILGALSRQRRHEVYASAWEWDRDCIPENVPLVPVQAPAQRRLLWRVPSLTSVADATRNLAHANLPKVDLCYTQHTHLGLAYRRLFPDIPIISHTGAMLADREYSEEARRPRLETAAESALINRLERQAYATSAWTHVVSTRLVARAREEHYGLPSGFFHIRALPVDPGRFNDAVDGSGVRRAFGIPEDVPLISFVGRLVALKQADELLAAVAASRSRPWILLAGDGPQQQTLRTMAADLGLGETTIFAGHTNPAPIIAASDFMVLPSLIESFGLAYAEAMTLGRPCIGLSASWPRAITAAPDTIPQSAGICVGSRVELIEAIDLLALDPSLRARLGKAAHEHARNHYSPAGYVSDVFDRAGMAA